MNFWAQLLCIIWEFNRKVTHLWFPSPVQLHTLSPDQVLQSVLVPRPGPGKDFLVCETRWIWRRWCGYRSLWGWTARRTYLEDRKEGWCLFYCCFIQKYLLMFLIWVSEFDHTHTNTPFSSSVTAHSSRAPEGLWTLADIFPWAPFRRTAKDAGWFTFRPDSYQGQTEGQCTWEKNEPISAATTKWSTVNHFIIIKMFKM